MAIRELSNNVLTLAKQAAKGTINDIPVKRAITTGGGFSGAPEYGSQPFSDGTKYGGRVKWLERMLGSFNPQILATPNEVGYVLFLAHGAETVTAPVNDVQTITSAATSGTFKLQFRDQRTTALNFDATSAAIVAALVALTKVGAGGFTATGGPLNTTPVVLTAAAGLAGKELPVLQIVESTLAGGASSVAHTTSGAKRKHRFTPGSTFHYFTAYQRVGGTTAERENHGDCRIGGFTFATGQGNDKPMLLTPTGFSFQPKIVRLTDPTLPGLPTADPFLHTNLSGGFTLDGTVFRGLVSLQMEPNEDLDPKQGDSTEIFDVAAGSPSVQIRPTIWLDQDLQTFVYKKLYGTATPEAGAKPLQTVGASSSVNADYKLLDQDDGYITGDRLVINVLEADMQLPASPGPNPAGGDAQMTLVGDARPSGGNPAYTIDVYNDDVAYT